MRAHRVITIAKRDYIATVRTKAFLFGLIVAPILFGGGSIAMSLLKTGPDLKDRRIALIDRTGAVADALTRAVSRKNDREVLDKKTGRQIAPRFVIETIPPAADAKSQLLALSGRVRKGELMAILEIGAQSVHPPKPAEDAKDESDSSDPAGARHTTPTLADSTRRAHGSAAH